MKKLLSLLAVTSAMFLSGVAQAQGPGGAPGASVTTETTTTTGDPGMTTYDAPEPAAGGTLPTTGGAPIAMALSGVLLAAGGFFVRRKLS